MLPAVEKTRSEGVEVAGAAKYFFANLDNVGNLDEFCAHQFSGLELFDISAFLKYDSNSLLSFDEEKKIIYNRTVNLVNFFNAFYSSVLLCGFKFNSNCI